MTLGQNQNPNTKPKLPNPLNLSLSHQTEAYYLFGPTKQLTQNLKTPKNPNGFIPKAQYPKIDLDSILNKIP